ncbi:MAG TPA: glycosyl transferase family 2 [Candidatus Limnocylindria bacterium]|nr:glycosyl transferase family 2 [Candidatus Limnocylindria bacterium]
MPDDHMTLDERLADGVTKIGSADVIVGIPSFRNAATIGQVAATAAKGLREYFPGARVAIVNADGGSNDGTPDRVVEGGSGVPVAVGRYIGPPGKGSAFRAIFTAVGMLGARACAVVDSDLRSITPEWIGRLLTPVTSGQADYITPLYARHKHDGTITNSVAYPLTRALYGLRVRQPIGGEFGFRADLARAYLERSVWNTDVARFGIDIFMTTTAIARGARVAQAFLGAKVHDPKDPAADLGPMFTQVVGTLFNLAAENESLWSKAHASKDVPVIGDPMPVEPEAVPADPARLREKYAAAKGEHQAAWREILSAPVPDTIDASAWARIVFDHLAAALRRPARSEQIARSLLPLYQLRTASFIEEVRDMTTTQSESVIEEGARAMEDEKSRFVERRSQDTARSASTA